MYLYRNKNFSWGSSHEYSIKLGVTLFQNKSDERMGIAWVFLKNLTLSYGRQKFKFLCHLLERTAFLQQCFKPALQPRRCWVEKPVSVCLPPTRTSLKSIYFSAQLNSIFVCVCVFTFFHCILGKKKNLASFITKLNIAIQNSHFTCCLIPWNRKIKQIGGRKRKCGHIPIHINFQNDISSEIDLNSVNILLFFFHPSGPVYFHFRYETSRIGYSCGIFMFFFKS